MTVPEPHQYTTGDIAAVRDALACITAARTGMRNLQVSADPVLVGNALVGMVLRAFAKIEELGANPDELITDVNVLVLEWEKNHGSG